METETDGMQSVYNIECERGKNVKGKTEGQIVAKGENWLNSLGLPKHSLQSR
jgi:hypothetical protein